MRRLRGRGGEGERGRGGEGGGGEGERGRGGEGERGRGGEGERGRGGEGETRGNQISYTVDTSWDAVDTRCLAGQVNYTTDLQL